MGDELNETICPDAMDIGDLVPDTVASGSNTPQGGKTTQLSETEFRKLSGAQRRKLLKQKAIEEGRTPPVFRKNKKKKGGEGAGARTGANSSLSSRPKAGGKRWASSSLESTNEGDRTLKRGKNEDAPYAAVAAGLPRVTLTCGDYLGGDMPAATVKSIKEAIVGKVLEIPDGDLVPTFEESFARRGTVVFICKDEESRAWLEGVAEHLDLGQGDLKVRVVKPEEVRVTKVLARMPPGVKTASDFVKLVRKQNTGVDTTRWAILNQTPEGYLVLGLDEPSANLLQSRNLRLSVGVGQVTFKLLDRKNTEAEVEASGTAQQVNSPKNG